MATVAEALPANAIDEMLQEIAPADLDNEDIIQFKNYLQQKDARQLHSLEEDLRAAARVRGRKIILRERLLERLDARFELHRDTSVENPLVGLTFVHDDAPYCLFRQCNSRVADWLRELGCGISGVPIHANFDVRNPIDPVQPARPVTLGPQGS